MGDLRRALGAQGEARAAAYLARRGYRIVGRNVRAGGVEIDLIVRRAGLVVFVEVKTRRGDSLGPPELAVHAAKQKRLVRGASAWLREHGRTVRRVRFDVIAWRVQPVGWKLRWIQGAFDASE